VALLIALGLALRTSGLDLHALDHEPAVGSHDILVFPGAKHAEEEAHLEASGSSVDVHCPVCMLGQSSKGLHEDASAPADPPELKSSATESPAVLPRRPVSLQDTRAPPSA
jgi:hypothetical protein